MCVTDFTFELPEFLIVHHPQTERSSYRSLFLDGSTGVLVHGTFADLPNKLNPRDLLVFNNTCVIPARLSGRKASGGKIEVPVECMLDDKHTLTHIRASKASKPGAELLLGGDENTKAVMVAHYDALSEAEFNNEHGILNILNVTDHMPLPPYINHPDEDADHELYRTVYSEKLGTVTTPAARLHFDDPLLAKLRDKGVRMALVTLHVGVGILQSVRVDTIEDRVMHSEYTEVPQDVVSVVLATRTRGSRAIAAGTAFMRSLESTAQAAKDDLIEPFFDDVQTFIYPGHKYQMIDVLITSFHPPESTLIILVSAFVGYKNTMHAYHEAIKAEYHFFSYGDTMFITYNPQAISERAGE